MCSCYFGGVALWTGSLNFTETGLYGNAAVVLVTTTPRAFRDAVGWCNSVWEQAKPPRSPTLYPKPNIVPNHGVRSARSSSKSGSSGMRSGEVVCCEDLSLS